MEFSIKVSPPEKAKTACIVVGIFESAEFDPVASSIDHASGGLLKRLVDAGDLPGKAGAHRFLYSVPGVAAERVLVIGLGKKEAFNAKAYGDAVRASVSAINNTKITQAWFTLAEIDVGAHEPSWQARHLVMAIADANYRFEQMKSVQSKKNALASITLGLRSAAKKPAYERGLAEGQAIAAGMRLAKDLGNLPGNACTPTYLAQASRDMAKQHGLEVEVLEQKDMERLKMGALLSVAKGSRQPPKFIVLRHRGAAKKEKPIVLVGKGITFDTGGISIKAAGEMDEMKFDMCGGAAVIGTLLAVAKMKLPLNVIGIVPTTENMPGGAASKPGDIVTTMSGQTVEILNTDAEGRLILCDALTYAERFDPAAVIDIATLTGACIIALGHVCSGLFANSEDLARELLDAGERSWDRSWRLPVWDDYQEQLKSNFADFANIGGRAAGSVTAACFLSRFTKKFNWAHLDIAGVAWKSGKEKGSTGRPIPQLTDFLLAKAQRHARR
ncbi:MAG: leucyl aminopeptidase [Burkholderiales bacterium]